MSGQSGVSCWGSVMPFSGSGRPVGLPAVVGIIGLGGTVIWCRGGLVAGQGGGGKGAVRFMVGCGGGVGVDHDTFLGVEPVFTGPELVAYLTECGVARPGEEAHCS